MRGAQSISTRRAFTSGASVVMARRAPSAHALRGLEVVLPHQPPHPLLRGAPPLNPQLRPHFSVALAMKRRGFEHPTNVGHQDVIRGGADRTAATTRRRGRGRLTPRIHAGAGAVPHAADPLHAINVGYGHDGHGDRRRGASLCLRGR